MQPIEVPFTRFVIEDKEVAFRVLELRTRESIHLCALVCLLEVDEYGYPGECRFVPYGLAFTQCPPGVSEELHLAMSATLNERVIPYEDDPRATEAGLMAAYDKIAEVTLAMSFSLSVAFYADDFFEVSFSFFLNE